MFIPKPGGGQRGLGIPNVIDRGVQQAMLQVLEPVFERSAVIFALIETAKLRDADGPPAARLRH